jgi:predicted Zn-dependent peptidase
VPYGEVPKVSIRLVVQTGAVDEDADEVALADLTGKLLDQGTPTRSADEIALDSARMGGAVTVDVGVNQVEIDIAVLAEFAPEAVALVAELARNPTLPEAELDRVRGDVLRELAIARSEPARIAERRFLEILYPDHPYGRPFPEETAVAGYTIEQVRRFHERTFAAGRATLYVVGRFEAAPVRTAIDRSLAEWARGREPSPVAPSPAPGAGIHLIDRPDAVQSTIFMGLRVTTVGHPDHLPLDVANTLLGGFWSSRITNNIREEKGYAYGPRSRIRPLLGTAYYVQVADVTTEFTGPALKEILYEIGRLQAELPSEEEVRTVRNYMGGDFILRNSSRTGITDQLAFLDLHGLDEDYLRSYVTRVQATTAGDLRRLAGEYLRPEAMAIVVVGDSAVVLDQLRSFGPVIEQPAAARRAPTPRPAE